MAITKKKLVQWSPTDIKEELLKKYPPKVARKRAKQILINEAQETYNRQIPQAKGEAERAINGARGFALERVNHAKGDVARFSAVLKEYGNAKEVTKQRLYLEAYQTILPNAQQIYIIDSEQKGLLPLPQLNQQGRKGGEAQ